MVSLFILPYLKVPFSASLSLLSIKSPESPVPDLMIATGIVDFPPKSPSLNLISSCFRGCTHLWDTEGHFTNHLLLARTEA